MSRRTTSPSAGDTNTQAVEPAGASTPIIAVNGETPNTDEAVATPAIEAEVVPKMSEITGIRYVGIADKRVLTIVDLEAMGAEAPLENLEWNLSNGRSVPVSKFNASTRDALLRDPNFLAY